ncbi:MAG: 2-amino-4-hydroxy-6-hydroxymethyldihydropteridine diphosphokinase [Flavobacteriaceae bacterium]|jgi:2-amino-4-hydroxy-6-hydroxymethyldihydropteridine diphosphokinase|nr:2-amino-4-hydroxy-6-hydroxymethyldihydropteridine diphosphokinase [Flavobacteriaceae bacterium]
MNEQRHIFIGLGSNVGDRLSHLQSAVDAIHYEVGSILKFSHCYESPAMGFEGDTFLNACLEVRTCLTAELVLSKLLQIEERLGRKRHDDGQYHARTIDLDILFFGDQIIENELLSVPHPRLEQRLFVLHPMVELAPDFVHPKLKSTTSKLLERCPDEGPISKVEFTLKNPLQAFDFSTYNFIAIEGNIGAGKTSLTHMMAQDFNAKSIFERFADNPFLPKFYEDAERYAFTLEMSFLADRYQQISDDLAQLDLFKDFIIADYDVFKSLIFSKITLVEDEFLLYRKLFYQVYKDIKRPDLYVYLHQNTNKLQQNIKKRGREYEKNLASDYLDKIHLGYLDFMKNNPQSKVKIIDISERDFIENRHDYLWLLEQIQG